MPLRRRSRIGAWYLGPVMAIMTVGLVAGPAPSGKAEPLHRPTADARPVMITSFEFTPQMITITAGGTVRWVNADVANHQITTGVVAGAGPQPDGRLSSPLLFRGDAFTATFAIPGDYPYYCSVHPFMRGTIVVK